MPQITYLLYDVSAVIALFTLILALVIRRLYKGRNNKLFLVLCGVLILSGILDVVTEYFDHFMPLNERYQVTRLVLTTLYFMMHNLLAPTYVLYISSIIGLWYKMRHFKTPLTLFWIIPYNFDLLLLLLNLHNHKIFYYDDKLNYVRGPWIMILYAVALYYGLMITYVLIRYKYVIGSKWFWSLSAMVPLNLLSVMIQMLVPHYRIEIFISTIMAIEVAIIVHRPEDMIDDAVGMQSYKAFLASVRTNFDFGNPTCHLMIRINNYRLLRRNLGMNNYVRMISNIASVINHACADPKLTCETFYLEQGSFVVNADVKRYDALAVIGRDISDYLRNPIKLGQMEVMVDACICLVKCPEDISTEDAFLDFEGTYNAKLLDVGQLVILSERLNDRDFCMRSDMDAIISRGIEGHRFMMYYQPIYDVAKRKFVTAEALIRLVDIEYGFVSPGLFIPAAEESGAIHDIGDYVIDEVCRFIGSQDFEELGLEYIEINLSVAQCIEANLHEKITECMNRYGVRPDQINLEITETAADYAPEITDRNIEMLAGDGIRFSLDDYGTGYSNVSRVVQMPLDIVKLDKSLVDDMNIPAMWTVIRNTVGMLKKMNKKVLVEGVEDGAAVEKFIDIGCDYIQGFYFSKPLPEKDYVAFVRERNASGE